MAALPGQAPELLVLVVLEAGSADGDGSGWLWCWLGGEEGLSKRAGAGSAAAVCTGGASST